jgi:hypothetical protein
MKVNLESLSLDDLVLKGAFTTALTVPLVKLIAARD